MRLTIPVSTVSRETMRPILEGLTELNRRILRDLRPDIPPLYAANVRYKPEPPTREDWDTADVVFGRGHGDCEDLAAWRAAELREAGEDADADCYVSRVRPDGRRIWHAIVRREDGTIEDPSLELGMRRHRGIRQPGTILRGAFNGR